MDQRYITKCCECPHFIKEVTAAAKDDSEKKARWTAKGCKVVKELFTQKTAPRMTATERDLFYGMHRLNVGLEKLSQGVVEQIPTCLYRLIELFVRTQVRQAYSWKETPELKKKFEHR